MPSQEAGQQVPASRPLPFQVGGRRSLVYLGLQEELRSPVPRQAILVRFRTSILAVISLAFLLDCGIIQS